MKSSTHSLAPRAQALAIVLALTLVGPLRVHAQDAAYASLADLDSTTQAVLGKEIGRARERGLPVEPLVAKAREGRLKRAPGARIRIAIERLSERLSTAREALGSNSTPDEITAAADAIAAGAQGSSLRAIRAATTQSVTAAVGALAQLLASGVSETKAVDMVVTLLRRNAPPAALVALGNQVERDVSSGLSPSAAATFRLRALEGELGTAVTTDAAVFPNVNSANKPGISTGGPPRRKP